MDGVESSGHVLRTPRRARGVKWKSKKKSKKSKEKRRKSKEKRKARPDDGDDVCAICDDGGYVTCCDGGCLRSFHLTEEHGEATKCPSLGLTSEQAKMIIDKKDFICKNCKYKQHQCSACGLLGLKTTCHLEPRKVFRCKDYSCGHFYHPKCVSELLHPDSKVRAIFFEQRVAAGLKFLCHVHKCSVCHGAENMDDKSMQALPNNISPEVFAQVFPYTGELTRPLDIPFQAKDGYVLQRAWDGILRDQTLIYCMKHEIVKELGIPMRKPIVFPDAKNPFVPKGPESAPKEQDILVEEELLDHPSSEPSQTPPPPATIQNQWFCSNPMDSFAPSSLSTRPYPGLCGWISDDDDDDGDDEDDD